MTDLRIAPDLALPLEIVTQKIAIVARTGAGKTYTATVLVEELLAAGRQVVVVDPTGAWWGLRLDADGVSPGLSVPVLGGEHGDLPLQPTAGALVADLLVDEGLSAVLDLSEFSNAEMTRFMTDFAETLYRRNRRPLHLVLDEADMFAPQRPLPESRRMLGAIEKIVRRGRIKGLGVTMVTQRPAVLNKNVLTQAGMLIALQTTGPQDQKAIAEWARAYGTAEQQDALLGSLAALPVGTAWVWSPALSLFARVQIRRRRTFDSSATPTVEGTPVQRELAPVNLAALGERLAALVDQAEEDDPARLRRRITELERQLAQRPSPEPERVEVPVLDPVQVERLIRTTDALMGLGGELTAVVRAAMGQAATAPGDPPPPSTHSNKSVTASKQRAATPDAAPKVAARPGREPSPEDEARLLSALATFPGEALSRDQMSVLAGLSAADDTLDRLLTLAKRRALVTVQGGALVLTAAGRDRLGSGAPLPADTAAERRAVWSAHLDGRERRILDELVALHPEQVSVTGLADRTGYPANGGFYGAVGRLVRLGLVTKDGALRGLGPMAQSRSDRTPPPRLRTVEA